MVTVRDCEGRSVEYPMELEHNESVLSQVKEPHRYPELSVLREEILGWRFYHQFRTDPESPMRVPRIGVRTPVLSNDGSDLVAALQTILEIGRGDRLADAVDHAFPGAELEIDCDTGRNTSRLILQLRIPGVPRPMEEHELSDGTLRYLCLVAALLSPRPPSFLALNEPEASLHPDLIEPLARLIADAAADSQLWVTTHSTRLAEYITEFSGESARQLKMVDGETLVVE